MSCCFREVMTMPCAAAGEENLPLLGAPGMTMMRLEPMLWTWLRMRFWADWPIDIRIITEAMPMTTPRTVKMERILPCVRLRVAVLKASLKRMVISERHCGDYDSW